ncbi:hypothetical protein IMG5_088090 [Ichthyophthirius multifiliis]|uniref:Uncharacterized protein n=1 Tax=Ichthyophthirius multifiliis TaxID=5932 RepID=G0QR36_ICHMU|nr:hypothetical protein IMG5_088090 [Ichthyophthirius multifiliis]EGR32321.1 hypothetical protein IMG5_088090 [Ichthyophthirius multifiliis]|eukprot:XP_004035807.1 hypothetical protein IMG5_088090 [Ichthyophthirius multifiliis]
MHSASNSCQEIKQYDILQVKKYFDNEIETTKDRTIIQDYEVLYTNITEIIGDPLDYKDYKDSEGITCIIENAYIKQQTNIQKPQQNTIIANKLTQIAQVQQELKAEHIRLKRFLIKDIQKLKQKDQVDIIAIVKQNSEIKQIVSKAGIKQAKRDIVLFDESQEQTTLTLFGKQTEYNQYNMGDVVLIKNGYISEYGDSRSILINYGNEPESKYIATVSITDSTANLYTQCFDDIGKQLFGFDAKEFRIADNKNNIELKKKLLSSCQNKEFRLLLLTQGEKNINDGVYREKTFIKKIKSIEPTIEAKRFLHMIDLYTDLQKNI